MLAKGYGIILIAYITLIWLDSWIVGGATIEGKSDLNIILSFKIVEFKDFLFLKYPSLNTDYFGALWNIGTWNFWFFDGLQQHIRLFTGLVLTAFLSWGVITVLIPIGLQTVSVMIQGVRAIRG